MKSKFRIGVLGIGGVGGYLAFHLVNTHISSLEIEISLITRPETRSILESEGLTLISPDKQDHIKPVNIISISSDIREMDLIIICVKSYNLEEVCHQLKPFLGLNTLILPFLNGADISEKIQKYLPDSLVLEGCVYIVARLLKPGTVKLYSNIIHFYFGGNMANDKLNFINQVFLTAGINSEIPVDIHKTVWEKYIFISPFATLTSYLNKDIGSIMSTPEYRTLMIKLVSEVVNVAKAKGINLENDADNQVIEKMDKVPPETTSSMHSDFIRGSQIELKSLTAYVVEMGITNNIETPTYTNLYHSLLLKSQS